MFTGEFDHTIDIKGRMIIPSKFRNLLGEDFVISKSLDGCLSVYEKSQWDEVGQKLNELPLKNNHHSYTWKKHLLQTDYNYHGHPILNYYY